MPYKALEVLNKYLAFEEKSQKSIKSEILKNALDFNPLMLARVSLMIHLLLRSVYNATRWYFHPFLRYGRYRTDS